jgi:hypothetical protein
MAQQIPKPDNWRVAMNNLASVIVTFDPGDKCSMDVRAPINDSGWAYEIVVNDDAYQNYVVAVVTLDEGKTLKDLQDYDVAHGRSGTPPYFSQLRMDEIVDPMSRSWHMIDLAGSPVYFVCLVEDSDVQRTIGEFGPVKVVP